MLHLLKLEWLKVKNYKAFWIFLGLYLVGLVGINYVAYLVKKNVEAQIPIDIFPYNFPKVYQTIAWISSWMLYFPGMLMILVISNEYTFKTHRQNIIDGLTRRQFIWSKILFAIVLAIITTLLCFIISVIFGMIFSSGFSFDGIDYIGYSFIQALCYILFAMFLAILLRRSGLAMAVFFLYGLIFEQLVGGLVDNKILNSHHFWYYMPLQASDVLVPSTLVKVNFYPDAPSQTVLVIVCALYIAIYCCASLVKFDKEDL